MITIIDYGSGNLRSVYNAFSYLGHEAKICQSKEELKNAVKIVLPGVGSSDSAMEALIHNELLEPLLEHLKKGTLFLGICLGLQLLFTESQEGAGSRCLDIVHGRVKMFPQDKAIKIPQIGWNTVRFLTKACPIFKGIESGSYFYFVHSYYGDTDEPYVAGVTEYGISYASSLWKDNIFAVQFHPERSQENGLRLLDNFARL